MGWKGWFPQKSLQKWLNCLVCPYLGLLFATMLLIMNQFTEYGRDYHKHWCICWFLSSLKVRTRQDWEVTGPGQAGHATAWKLQVVLSIVYFEHFLSFPLLRNYITISKHTNVSTAFLLWMKIWKHVFRLLMKMSISQKLKWFHSSNKLESVKKDLVCIATFKMISDQSALCF